MSSESISDRTIEIIKSDPKGFLDSFENLFVVMSPEQLYMLQWILVEANCDGEFADGFFGQLEQLLNRVAGSTFDESTPLDVD